MQKLITTLKKDLHDQKENIIDLSDKIIRIGAFLFVFSSGTSL